MIIHRDPSFNLYIGDVADKLYPAEYLTLSESDLIDHPLFMHLKKTLPINHLFFLRQTHSVDGLVINQATINTRSFAVEGDFLITNQRHVGIGVMTADCLAIALYDPIQQAIGIAHAGWRGTVDHIVEKVIHQMSAEYGTQPAELQVYFGPSAKVCCYEVAPEFVQHLASFSYADELIREHHGKLFFDVPLCNRLQLQQLGVPDASIHQNYNACTIEDESYFSHRRQREHAGRQMMVISLA